MDVAIDLPAFGCGETMALRRAADNLVGDDVVGAGGQTARADNLGRPVTTLVGDSGRDSHRGDVAYTTPAAPAGRWVWLARPTG